MGYLLFHAHSSLMNRTDATHLSSAIILVGTDDVLVRIPDERAVVDDRFVLHMTGVEHPPFALYSRRPRSCSRLGPYRHSFPCRRACRPRAAAKPPRCRLGRPITR